MKSPFFSFLLIATSSLAQPSVSKVWLPDLGNGEYKNPVLHADYSDPDAIRVGDDFYIVSSTSQTNDSGYADFDWFRVEPVK